MSGEPVAEEAPRITFYSNDDYDSSKVREALKIGEANFIEIPTQDTSSPYYPALEFGFSRFYGSGLFGIIYDLSPNKAALKARYGF